MKIDLNDPLQVQVGQTLLTAAVQRQIFCPYTNTVLDIRRAVLLDSDTPGVRMTIMTAAAYDAIKDDPSLAAQLAQYDVIDGRELFKEA